MTVNERQILTNQYSILELLDPENAEDYSLNKEILRHGFEAEYETVTGGMYEPLSVSECEYVREVLQMHRALKQSYDALEDKQGIDLSSIEFRGFDGNNESQRYSYARFLAELGQFTESDGRKNSHTIGTKTRYPRMMAKWEAIEQQHGLDRKWEMTAEDIREVVSQ